MLRRPDVPARLVIRQAIVNARVSSGQLRMLAPGDPRGRRIDVNRVMMHRQSAPGFRRELHIFSMSISQDHSDETAYELLVYAPGQALLLRSFPELGRHVEGFLWYPPACGCVVNAYAALIAHDLQVGSDREVVDADERGFNKTDVVVVLDLPVRRVFEVLGCVDVAEDPPAVVRWARGWISLHPPHHAPSFHDVFRGQADASSRDEFDVLPHFVILRHAWTHKLGPARAAAAGYKRNQK